MATHITPEGIARYRRMAKKSNRDISHLTDLEIAGQIRLLKGGLRTPSKSELREIMARRKHTEKVFQECERGVLSDLKKACSDLRKLDRSASRRPAASKDAVIRQKSARIVLLHRALLSYAPSLLRREFQGALDRVREWSSLAENVLQEGSRKGERLFSSVSEELASLIEGLDIPRKSPR